MFDVQIGQHMKLELIAPQEPRWDRMRKMSRHHVDFT